MLVGYADDHSCDVYRFLNIHTKGIIMSRDVRWLNIIWKQYKMKSNYARKQVELFLDQEERSLEDERSFGESSIEEIEEESESDGNNTETQKKLGIDINMIGARKETLGKTRSETKALSSPRNESRELSKTMDAPAPVHLKEMYKVIRHVLSTKGHGLKFELRKHMIKWVLKALTDSYFASDKETKISVFGYIIYFCGIPIAWRSKGMKSVVLSTTEAEYMALSEVVKELKFIVQLLQTMNIEVELPITVHVDNVGSIWLSNNHTTSYRTKHIDIRTSFVKEYQEDGKIVIKFVKSKENEKDIFTKNTTNVIFSNHQ